MHANIFRVILPAGICAFASSSPAGATEHLVRAYSSQTFVPADLTIAPGDTIRFENGGGTHNVHADDDRFICSVDCTTNNGPSGAEWSVVVAFPTAGTFGYYCDKHGGPAGGMRGTIRVVERIFADGFDRETSR